MFSSLSWTVPMLVNNCFKTVCSMHRFLFLFFLFAVCIFFFFKSCIDVVIYIFVVEAVLLYYFVLNMHPFQLFFSTYWVSCLVCLLWLYLNCLDDVSLHPWVLFSKNRLLWWSYFVIFFMLLVVLNFRG